MPSKNSIHTKNKIDLVFIVFITIGTYLIAGYFELAEAWLEWASAKEEYQLDEIIFVFLAQSICLIWFSHRRYQELKATLEHNLAISAKLESKNIEANTLLSQNRELIKHITQVREAERNELATELHDVFGQHLAAIEVNAAVASKYSDNDKLKSIIETIQTSANCLINVTRSQLRTIKPPNLEYIGLTAVIEEFISQWHVSFPDYELTLSININDEWVDYDTALTFYRCLQEGLSNIVKHANAQRISVIINTDLENRQKTLNLTLEDNGTNSFSADTDLDKGLGLINMRERVTALSGQLDMHPAESQGTVLVLTIPL